jgi:hypothetical protein
MAPVFFILTLFVLIDGNPQVEAYTTPTLEECHMRGRIAVSLLKANPKADFSRYVCVSTGPLARPA